MFATLLLPTQAQLAVTDCQIDAAHQQITLWVTSTEAEARCPVCHEASTHVHSHYQRRLADLPWAEDTVTLRWTVRRLLCDNPRCKRQTFVEQMPALTQRYGRKTQRCQHRQAAIAFEAGGESGHRLVVLNGLPTSADSLFRLIEATADPAVPTPRVLGVDDWALRKGQTYGTIFVDLETHRPIDLVADRSASVLATWLKQHPGVEIISRDRSREYALGATQGAPDAVQVADRWHLLQNLRTAVITYLEHHPAGRLATASPANLAVPPLALPAPNPPVPPTPAPMPPAAPPLSQAHQLQVARQEKRLARYQQVRALQQQGVSQRAMAAQLHMSRKTILKFTHADAFPTRAARRKTPGKLTPYEPYLEAQWAAGQHNGLQLWREIKAQGYTGSRGLVSLWAAPRRTAPRVRREKATWPAGTSITPATPAWSVNRAAWLVVLDKDRLTATEQTALQRMIQADPQVGVLNMRWTP